MEAGTNLEAALEGGDVARVVRRATKENHADLVVIGRGISHERFGRMRTHVYSIIREAPCPVISVCGRCGFNNEDSHISGALPLFNHGNATV